MLFFGKGIVVVPLPGNNEMQAIYQQLLSGGRQFQPALTADAVSTFPKREP